MEAMGQVRKFVILEWRTFKLKYIFSGGVSPYYTKKIGNPTLRNINQNLRNTKFPYDNWRTADPGHIHYKWRLNDEDSWHWFR